ncbi:MAG: Holliday junction resolvase RuvX [Gammaproteobacteria bacterium]|nr:Holliday junction resolvase RuvX [Gammaproteobacteria bacterium]
MSRFMGLDYGKERVGVALSDPTGSMATPHTVLPLQPFRKFLGALKALTREHEVEQIVVGIPRNMDGSYGPSSEAARQFASKLEEALTIPVEKFDERLTTVQASKALRAGGKSAKQQKEIIDSAAAQIILQTYLEHLSFKSGGI